MKRADSGNVRVVLAKNIRQMRAVLGMSQEGLADEAGLHRTYVGAIERAERNVSVDNIDKIARALGCDIASLFEGWR
ncbi:MAG: helix-turn-helix domain-containing protein [Alphaproteobacteria bacterium]|nr:helix-turn-helix domain-containing protein [Alphaproteobacteria bacterium]